MRQLVCWASLLVLTMGLGACASSPAPAYQPGIANLHVLRAGTAPIGVDDFDAASGVNDQRLSVRADSLSGAGSDGTFSTYLQQALETELRVAGRFDQTADLRLSGTLTVNSVEAMNFSVGRASVGARFVLKRRGLVTYDKVLVANHEWDSSFIGALAIPAAMQGYSATVQKLTGQLFADPEFLQATR